MKGGARANQFSLSPKDHAALGLCVLQVLQVLKLPIGNAFMGEWPKALARLE